jgi:flagellar hook-basal body complex protein FliE
MGAIGGLGAVTSAMPELNRSPQAGGEQAENFIGVLKDAIGQAESLHDEAQQHVSALLAGSGEEMHSAVIAVEKADISFQLMMQVRNKIVAAYQEVARMQF